MQRNAVRGIGGTQLGWRWDLQVGWRLIGHRLTHALSAQNSRVDIDCISIVTMRFGRQSVIRTKHFDA